MAKLGVVGEYIGSVFEEAKAWPLFIVRRTRGRGLKGSSSVNASARSFERSGAATALMSLAWLALLAWARPLWLPDEGRYVGVAWEMMRSGDWLVPTLDGLPYFHKPPLFYWITAAAMTAFGPVEWAARAAPVLGAWAGAMGTFLFLRRWREPAIARLALLVLMAQPLFYIGGQFANLDMLVAGCITVTIVLLAHAALLCEAGATFRVPLIAAYAAAALGMLAKGLIGFVLPALVICTWLLLRRRWRTLRSLVSVPGILVFLAVAAPWFIAMQLRFADFLNYFFVVQHFKRYAVGGFNNVQPPWFYPVVLILFTLPWLPWLRPHLERGRLADPVRGDLRLLLWAWFAVIVVFFSLPASKLLGYVLPAVPPLAGLLADGLETWLDRQPRSGRLWSASACVSVASSLAIIGVLSVRTPHSTADVGEALRTFRKVGEPVHMLGNYYFDLPFYARLPEPAPVVLNWAAPEIRLHDTWRKELADAGAFAPARARGLLLMPATLDASLCAQPVSWVVGPADAAQNYAFLARGQVVARGRNAVLWRIERTRALATGSLKCAGVPGAG